MNAPTPESVTFDAEVYEHVTRRMRDRLLKPREGVHVSDLIYCPLKQWARKHLVSPLEEPDDEQMFVWVIGRSHEDLLGTVFVGKPIEQDGIIGTIDWWEQEGKPGLLVEGKSTRSSSRKDVGDLAHYVAQAASYCYLHKVTECCIAIFHIMGDYTRGFIFEDGNIYEKSVEAHFRPWRISFTQEELDSWWEELQSRKDVLEASQPPEFDEDRMPFYEWECGYCREGGLIGCPKWKGMQEKRLEEYAKKEAKKSGKNQPL